MTKLLIEEKKMRKYTNRFVFIVSWIVEEIQLDWLRTIPAVATFAFGVAALLSAFTLLKGLETREKEMLERYGANNFSVEYAIEEEEWVESYSEITNRLSRMDVRAIVDNANDVEYGAIVRRYVPSEVIVNNTSIAASVLVIENDFFEVFSAALALLPHGRSYDDLPSDHILIGPDLELAGQQLCASPEMIVQIDGVFFQAGNVCQNLNDAHGEPMKPYNYSDSLLLSLTAFETQLLPFGNSRSEEKLWFRAKDGRLAPALFDQVHTQLRNRHIDDTQFSITTADYLVRLQSENAQRFVHILFGVSLLLTIGSVVALLNSTLASLKKRYADFGLLRALGLSRLDICKVLMGEAVLIALVGSLIGVGIGWFIGRVVSELYGVTSQFAILVSILSVVGFCLVGILSTLIPISRVFSRDPAHALRD